MTTKITLAALAIVGLLLGAWQVRSQFQSTPVQASGVQASDGVVGQAAAPADMPVTFKEYDEGFQAMTACLAKIGWLPERPPRLTTRNVYDFQFYMPNAGLDPSQAQRSAWENGFQACQADHFDRVQRVWEIKMSMSEAESQNARDFLSACMRGQGVQIAEHPVEADLVPLIRITAETDRAAHKVFQRCLVETQHEFDLRNGEVP